MYKYLYDGPVMEFDFCVVDHWKATTIAPSEAKARSNLAYRYKMEHGLKPTAKVSCPGKLVGEYLPERSNYIQLSIEEAQ